MGLDNIIAHHERIGSPANIDGAKSDTPLQAVPAAVQGLVPARPAATMPAKSSYQPVKSSYQPNRQPVERHDPGVRISDIDSLNPYPGGRWTIKARVTNRTSMKTWSNARGEGKLFSVELLDAKGGEIRATMFNDMVDKYFEMMTPGSTFYLSGGKIKMANRKFSSLNNNYEITIDQYSEIRPAPEDAAIATAVYNFKKIATVETVPAESNIDVIGIVKSVGECVEFTSKAGKQLFKRDLVLVDDSLAEVKITLWNEKAKEDYAGYADNVVAIKGCRVSDFNGKSLSSSSSSTYSLNPDIPEAGVLMNWYSSGGNSVAIKSLSSGGGFGGGGMGEFADRALLSDIKEKELGMQAKPDYVTVKATVSYLKHDKMISYQACATCQKKVIQDVNQNFLCEKCQTTTESCENRYILSCSLQDGTGTSWVTAFNDMGKTIMRGKSADEMAELQMTNIPEYDSCFVQAQFQEYLFRLRVKAENVQEELRVKSSIVSMEPLDYVKESNFLLEAIRKYNY